jgi:hypothetical protein
MRADFAESMLRARERARRAGTRPPAATTPSRQRRPSCATSPASCSPTGANTQWTLVDIHDIEAFLGDPPKSRKRKLLVSLADKPLVGLTSTTKDPKLLAAAFGMDPKRRADLPRRLCRCDTTTRSIACRQLTTPRKGTAMAGMSVTWNLNGNGWADIVVTDQQAEARITASYITTAPEDLLTAVARLLLGENETRAQFEAEPIAFRWIFHREGNDVWIQLLELPDGRKHDNAGTEIWSSWQTVDTVARAVTRCFDEVAHKYGESGYRGRWNEHFPRSELDALRAAWRASQRTELS